MWMKAEESDYIPISLFVLFDKRKKKEEKQTQQKMDYATAIDEYYSSSLL